MSTAETAAETVAETITGNGIPADQVNQTLTNFDWIYLAIGIAAIGAGIFEIVTGRVIGRKKDTYTEESLKKFAKYDGICYMIVGLGSSICSAITLSGKMPMGYYWMGTAILFAGIIADGVLAKKMLVEKDKNVVKKFKK